MIRDELGSTLARAAREVLPGQDLPDCLELTRGRGGIGGDWVCSWCLKAARGTGMDAAALAEQIVGALPEMPDVARVTAQGGFLNVYLSDAWYMQTLEAYKNLKLQLFAVPQVPVDAHQRLAALWPGARSLIREDALWYLHRDRSNPLYAIRYAAQRSGQLAVRTAAGEDSLTVAARLHVRNLDDCVSAAQACSASVLCAALYAASGSFRAVYEEQKPGFRARNLAAATANLLLQGLKILGLAE